VVRLVGLPKDSGLIPWCLGAENFLHLLLNRLQEDIAISTSSLHCLKLEPSLRAKAAQVLVPTSKIKKLFYVLLVARGRVVTIVRPKKHSVHPADLHIILNTIHAPSIMNSTTSWLPICLPKYNMNGFVHAYVSFLRNGDLDETPTPSASPVTEPGDTTEQKSDEPGAEQAQDAPEAAEPAESSEEHDDNTPSGDAAETATIVDTRSSHLNRDSMGADRTRPLGIGLVCITGGGDLDDVQQWSDNAASKLEADGTIHAICKAIRDGSIDYSVAQLSIPGLRHFVYKSRAHVQVTYPVFEDPYHEEGPRRRLITLYQTLHDAIHAKSGQEGPLKLQYIRTEQESVMGWITQPFELYLSVSSRLPKSAAIGAANAIVKWVKKEEARLFLRDAPTFNL